MGIPGFGIIIVAIIGKITKDTWISEAARDVRKSGYPSTRYNSFNNIMFVN